MRERYDRKVKAAPGHYAKIEDPETELETSNSSSALTSRPKKTKTPILPKMTEENMEESNLLVEKEVVDSLQESVTKWHQRNGLMDHRGREIVVPIEESDKDLITLVVDDSDFRISRNLVCYFSPVLHLVFQNPDVVCYTVPNTTKNAMFLFIRCLKTGAVHDKVHGMHAYPSSDYLDLALLANQLFVAVVQNSGLVKYHRAGNDYGQYELNFGTVYGSTRKGSIIWEFVFDLFVVCVGPAEMKVFHDQQETFGLSVYPKVVLDKFNDDIVARHKLKDVGDDIDLKEYLVNGFTGTISWARLGLENRW